jgi:hypothetical protein
MVRKGPARWFPPQPAIAGTSQKATPRRELAMGNPLDPCYSPIGS